MNLNETVKLLFIIRGLYPRDKAFDKTKDDLAKIAEVWKVMLSDVPFDLAQAAVLAIASTSQFAPGISDIRIWYMNFRGEKTMDADEAWGLVQRAIKQHGYSQADKAQESMPINVWRMVERMGWRNLCMSEEPGVERGQFMKMWGIYQKRADEMSMLPPAVRQIIKEVSQQREPGALGMSGDEMSVITA